MKKIFLFIITFALFCCQNKKEIKLPKANGTLVANVQDHSPIYIFFKISKNDTLADVNRKNAISSTHWIFNIDKRLPLRLVIPEITKLQVKKEGSMHQNEAAENYFSYSNPLNLSMAFLPFTQVKFRMDNPSKNAIYFGKNGLITFDSHQIKKSELADFIYELSMKSKSEIILCFDKNCSFDDYIKNKVSLLNLVIKNKDIVFSNLEYVY